MPDPFSENAVRKAALRYLRNFYGSRQAEGQPLLVSEGRRAGSIVADGYLKYMASDGKEYEVTVEATGLNSRGEVMYKPLPAKLTWDALMLTSWTLVLLVGLAMELGWIAWEQQGPIVFWMILVSGFLFLFLALRRLLRPFRRYRYIYAIEQFKAYHTDDQWIAIAANVFPEPTDPFYRELRRQCIASGVGLLKVSESGETNLIIAASRGTLDLGERKRVDLREGDVQWLRPLERASFRWLGKDRRARGPLKTEDLLRYKPNQWKQFSISLLAWSVLLIFAWRFYQQKPVRELSRREWRTEFSQPRSIKGSEPDYFLIDSASLVPYGREISRYLSLMDSLRESPLEPPVSYAEPRVDTRGSLPGLLVPMGPDTVFAYSCDRLAGLTPEQYALMESKVASETLARIRVQQVRQAGLDVKAYRLSCLRGDASGYLLFWQIGFETAAGAQEALLTLEELYGENPDIPSLEVVRLDAVIELE